MSTKSRELKREFLKDLYGLRPFLFTETHYALTCSEHHLASRVVLRICAEGYAHQFRTSSHVRFLFECSSESTSGGTAIFISSPLASSGISSRLVYIQVRPRPQIYDSVYRVAVVSCAWDRKKEKAAFWIPEWNSNTL